MAKQVMILQTQEIDEKILDECVNDIILKVLSFNENGELVVSINGENKIFVPKTEVAEASYDTDNEKIIINNKK